MIYVHRPQILSGSVTQQASRSRKISERYSPSNEDRAWVAEEPKRRRTSTKIHNMADTTATEKKSAITIKVTMVGDAAVGKTSFMARFVEGNYNEDYVETLGVNFMNKTIKFFGREVVFSVWDLGGTSCSFYVYTSRFFLCGQYVRICR